MKFKTKLLSAVLFSAIGVASSSQAVVLSENGTGQVLLYPYYTVQGGNETYFSIVNTTAKAKAVKVRFLEAKNSREVLDFNLYLSPQDVWTAAIVPAGDGAAVRTVDNSCTAPVLSAGAGGSTGTLPDGQTYRQQAFRSYAYTNDGAGSGLDRTKEGYIEVIEMGELNDQYVLASSGSANTNFEWAITHTAAGVPNDCGAVITEWQSGSPFIAGGVGAAVLPPQGGLIGKSEMINVGKGTAFSADPVALEWFSTLALHTPTGSLTPSLQEADPESTVFAGASATSFDVYTTDWSNAAIPAADANDADAVSAVLMRSSVLNEFSTEASVGAATDWVINFPTKRFYVSAPPAAPNQALIASGRPFSSNFTNIGACEEIGLSLYDREEARTTTGIDFSPTPPGQAASSLCWEVNVITFNNSDALKGELTRYDLETKNYKAGWIELSFPSVTVTPAVAGATTTRHQMVAPLAANTFLGGTPAALTYSGLPVIGFAAQSLVNDNVSNGVLSNYGSTSIHKYRTDIQ